MLRLAVITVPTTLSTQTPMVLSMMVAMAPPWVILGGGDTVSTSAGGHRGDSDSDTHPGGPSR